MDEERKIPGRKKTSETDARDDGVFGRKLVRGKEAGASDTDGTAPKTQVSGEEIYLPETIFEDWNHIKDTTQQIFVGRMNEGEITYEEYADKEKFVELIQDIFDGDVSLQLPLDLGKKKKLYNYLWQEFYGLGGLEDYLNFEETEDIVLNRFDQLYIYTAGDITSGDSPFKDDKEVAEFLNRIYAAQGREINRSNPIEDGTLPDGSRIVALVPPVVEHPIFVIRKHNIKSYSEEEYLKKDMFPTEFLDDLKTWVKENQTLVLSGATGSGKTTFLNFVSSLISNKDRICVIENTKELQMQGKNVVPMQAVMRGARQGRGDISAIRFRDLVSTSLRLRPDRIIVGECRGAEAFDMLQAINTGHEGSMTTLHANSPQDAIKRLESMASQAEENLPLSSIQDMIGSGIDVIIQVERSTGEAKRVVKGAIQVINSFDVDIEELPQGKYGIQKLPEHQTVYILPLWTWDPVERKLVRHNDLVQSKW